MTMGITENYSILHDLPVYHDEGALEAGRHKIRFNSSLKARFGVIPRYGAADSIRWFEFSPCFLYHVVNCWEEGDEVVMVACRYMPARHDDGSIDEHRTAKMIAGLVMDARLWRYRMNVETGEGTEECLDSDRNVRVSRLQQRNDGQAYPVGLLRGPRPGDSALDRNPEDEHGHRRKCRRVVR